MHLQVMVIYHLSKKTPKVSYNLVNSLCDFLQIWCAVSPSGWEPPQHIWYQSDKRSWSYECMKIMTLLFLLIYSSSLHAPRFLGQRYKHNDDIIVAFHCFCMNKIVYLAMCFLFGFPLLLKMNEDFSLTLSQHPMPWQMPECVPTTCILVTSMFNIRSISTR